MSMKLCERLSPCEREAPPHLRIVEGGPLGRECFRVEAPADLPQHVVVLLVSAKRSSSAATGEPDRIRARQWSTCAAAARKSLFYALQRACATTRFSRPSSG